MCAYIAYRAYREFFLVLLVLFSLVIINRRIFRRGHQACNRPIWSLIQPHIAKSRFRRKFVYYIRSVCTLGIVISVRNARREEAAMRDYIFSVMSKQIYLFFCKANQSLSRDAYTSNQSIRRCYLPRLSRSFSALSDVGRFITAQSSLLPPFSALFRPFRDNINRAGNFHGINTFVQFLVSRLSCSMRH